MNEMDWDAAVLAAMMACLGWLVRHSINGLKTDLTQRLDRLEETYIKAIEGLRTEIGNRTEAVKTELTGRLDRLEETYIKAIEGLRTEIGSRTEAVKTEVTGRIDRLEETNAKAVEGLRAEIGSRTGEVKTDLAKRIDELDAVNRAEHARLAMDVKGLRSQVDKLDGYAGLDFASRLKTYLRNVPPEGDE